MLQPQPVNSRHKLHPLNPAVINHQDSVLERYCMQCATIPNWTNLHRLSLQHAQGYLRKDEQKQMIVSQTNIKQKENQTALKNITYQRIELNQEYHNLTWHRAEVRLEPRSSSQAQKSKHEQRIEGTAFPSFSGKIGMP
jgi:hypothetical protein